MVITVHCTSCWTAFPVDPNKVPPKGVNARCSVCSHVFRVERPPEDAEAADATLSEAPAPEAPPVPHGPEAPGSEGEGIPEEAVGHGEAPSEVAAEGAGHGFEATVTPVDGPPVLPEDGGLLHEGSAAMERAFEGEIGPEPEPLPEMGAVSHTETLSETEDVAEPEVPTEMEPFSGMEAATDAEAGPEEGATPDEASFPMMEEVPGIGSTAETEAAAPTDGLPETGVGAGIDASQPDGASPEGGADQDQVPTSDVGLEAATPEDAWVFEREPDLDPSEVSYEPLQTLEEELAQFGREADLEQRDATIEVQETFEASVDFWARRETSVEGGELPPPDNGVAVSHEAPPPIEPTGTSPSPIGAFTLGKRDPAERARRLARVLVSDMIMYNPERHQRALASGTLESDFEEEIAKSWKEYVEQVGRDVAESTDYWRAALNDVLAGGRPVF